MTQGPSPLNDVRRAKADPDRRANLAQRWPSWGPFWNGVPEAAISNLARAPTNGEDCHFSAIDQLRIC